MHCIKKTDASWKTKNKVGLKSVVFKQKKLKIDKTPRFNISKDFDFFILENEIFIKNKKIFESILSYKNAHISNFSELVDEVEFSGLFTDSEPLKKYVSTNTIHLRRASAIKQKGYYKIPAFMESLRMNALRLKLNLTFDESGKIIVNDGCCADILSLSIILCNCQPIKGDRLDGHQTR